MAEILELHLIDGTFSPTGNEEFVEKCSFDKGDIYFEGEPVFEKRIFICPILKKNVKVVGSICHGPDDDTKCEHNHY